MQHSDFHIGLEFLGPAGLCWRCTDIGTRTIVAIQLQEDDPDWYRGPPYFVGEVVFDEPEIGRCHLTYEELLGAAIDAAGISRYPGCPANVVDHMMRARFDSPGAPYPHKGVLRFDRCAPEGEILHPYTGRKDGARWIVRRYLPFRRTCSEMPEGDFIALPSAAGAEVRARADQAARDLAVGVAEAMSRKGQPLPVAHGALPCGDAPGKDAADGRQRLLADLAGRRPARGIKHRCR